MLVMAALKTTLFMEMVMVVVDDDGGCVDGDVAGGGNGDHRERCR